MIHSTKIFLAGVVVLFLFSAIISSTISCSSGPFPDPDASAREVVNKWASGLKNKDIELLMGTYWPEAVFTFIPSEGDEMVLTGSEEIRSGQEGGFVDRPDIDILLESSKEVKTETGYVYTVSVLFHGTDSSPATELVNILHLEERNTVWKIIKQVVSIKQ